MVPSRRPDIALEKVPAPVPSVVFVAIEKVGFVLVLHTTPLAVTAAPPSLEISPPLETVVVFIAFGVVVVKVGRVFKVPNTKANSLEEEEEFPTVL